MLVDVLETMLVSPVTTTPPENQLEPESMASMADTWLTPPLSVGAAHHSVRCELRRHWYGNAPTATSPTVGCFVTATPVMARPEAEAKSATKEPVCR